MKKEKDRILIRVQESMDKPGKWVAWLHIHPTVGVEGMQRHYGEGMQRHYGKTEGKAAGKVFAMLVDKQLIGNRAVEVAIH